MVYVIVEASVFEVGTEKREELFDDSLLVFAKPRTIVDVKIWALLCLKVFCEDLKEGGFAEAISLVDVDDEGAFVGLGSIEGREDFFDKDTSRGVSAIFIFGSGLVGIERGSGRVFVSLWTGNRVFLQECFD